MIDSSPVFDIARKMASTMRFQVEQQLRGVGDWEDFTETQKTFLYSVEKLDPLLSQSERQAFVAARELYDKTDGVPKLKALEALASVVEHLGE